MTEETQWRRCSACKKPIALGAEYWVCNVSTCNRKRTGLVFCTVSCWDAHLPVANHRESWAVEARAPTEPEEAPAPRGSAQSRAPRRRIVRDAPQPGRSADPPSEILIVASRLKDYVRARSGYNTSEKALGPLSDIVRRACDEAIETASRDGRKTVLDRDIPRR